MQSEQISIFIILCCITAIMLFFYVKQRHPMKSVLFGSISGIGSLIGMRLLLGTLGAALPLNLFTCWISAVLGIPGVIAISVLQII